MTDIREYACWKCKTMVDVDVAVDRVTRNYYLLACASSRITYRGKPVYLFCKACAPVFKTFAQQARSSHSIATGRLVQYALKMKFKKRDEDGAYCAE